MKDGHIGFRLDGEQLTKLCRSLWTDDREPEKAIYMLEQAFDKMSQPTIMAIITGSKKLVGVNTMELIDDDAEYSPAGNRLSNIGLFRDWRKQIDCYKDFIQLRNNYTRAVATPIGLCYIPERRYKEYINGELTLNEIPHRLSIADPLPREVAKVLLNSIEEEKYVLPTPTDKINELASSGWITDDGKFYLCTKPWEHDRQIEALGLKEEQVEKAGWIKMSERVFYHVGRLEPTQKQKDMIFDWCEANKETVPRWLFEN